jgi:hypothetical protein
MMGKKSQIRLHNLTGVGDQIEYCFKEETSIFATTTLDLFF